MNLEQAIHQRWAASDALAALLPAANVKTGRSFGDPVPYATIARETSRTVFRTNAGDALDEVTLQINVWHDSYDAGLAVVEQVQAAFDRSGFTLAGGDTVVQMRRVADSTRQHEDGRWQWTVKFLVDVYLPLGV